MRPISVMCSRSEASSKKLASPYPLAFAYAPVPCFTRKLAMPVKEAAVTSPAPSWHESPEREDKAVGGTGAEHDAPVDRCADAALAVREQLGDPELDRPL